MSRESSFRIFVLCLVPFVLVGLYIGLTLPPATARLPAGQTAPNLIFGAYHIHTNRSDGTGTPEEIARAAARAGLRFVILTDHGDATRPADPPQYRDGVLVIDAVEVGTSSGHVVALGLTQPAPYPLGGEPRDVIDDLHRMGAWTIVAHPDSPKPELRWRNGSPYDGIEWLNIDSEWRDESAAHLAGTIARYLIRPPETVASLFQKPVQTLRRWDAAARSRPVVGLAALDAHARLPWRNRRDPQRDGTIAKVPSYVQMFRTVEQAVIADHPLSGNAANDTSMLLSALRAGRTFSVVAAFADAASLDFRATRGDAAIAMGESIGAEGAPVAFQARVNDPLARVALVHNGAEIASARGEVHFTGSVTAGAYRVEAYRPGMSVPWIVSNPIFAADANAPATPPVPPPPVRLEALPGRAGWVIEKNASSTAAFASEVGSTRFSYTLGPGVPFDQYAALVSAVDERLAQEGFDRVQFTVRADRPCRFSVQLRLPGSADRRWRYSVYADQTPRQVVVNLQDFQPVNREISQRPVVAYVRSVLFVVDTMNTRPSSAGTIWLSDVALGVGRIEK